jgi:hypothetical protein
MWSFVSITIVIKCTMGNVIGSRYYTIDKLADSFVDTIIQMKHISKMAKMNNSFHELLLFTYVDGHLYNDKFMTHILVNHKLVHTPARNDGWMRADDIEWVHIAHNDYLLADQLVIGGVDKNDYHTKLIQWYDLCKKGDVNFINYKNYLKYNSKLSIDSLRLERGLNYALNRTPNFDGIACNVKWPELFNFRLAVN